MAALRPLRGKPGVYALEDGRTIRIIDWYDGWVYDTVVIHNNGSAISDGQAFVLFRDLTSKDEIDANLGQPNRISKGQEIISTAFGVHIGNRTPDGNFVSAKDFAFCLERLYLDFRINKDTVAAGPLMVFQSGVGIYGVSQESGATVLANGVPSRASVKPLLVQQPISADHDLSAKIIHYGASWMTGYLAAAPVSAAKGVPVKLMINGYVKKAIGRG
jgi:hypothetical protein